jgi:predicted GH43/DUF377 family glycosyl hydrolase
MKTPKGETDPGHRQWNRRRFLQGAATVTGAALAKSITGVAAEAKDNQNRTHSGEYGHHQVAAAEPVLPEWAIGPFTRYANPRAVPYEGNPLITPHGPWRGSHPGWESRTTFNPGVVYHDGKFQMLYRGESPNDHTVFGSPQIGYAYSTDGYHFTEYPGNPVISGFAVDPRLYRFNGKYYAFYIASGKDGIAVASSDDMIHWTRLGTALPVEKDGFDPAIVADPHGHPVKINGRYVMYYGSSDRHGSKTHMAFSNDLVHWTDYTHLDLHFPVNYRPFEICITLTDYPTVQGRPLNKNILMFVAGGLMAQGRWFYAISEVLFSRKDLSHQLGQLTFPILEPTTPYEALGVAFRTVFMNTILFHKGQWWMYYGAGDRVIALANAPLRSKESLHAYNNFTGTGFETNQRQPDWVDEVDKDHGGGGIKNVGAPSGSELDGPQAIVSYGYAPSVPYNKPKGIQDYADAYVRIFERKAHSGDAALLYSGAAQGGAQNYAYLKVFDLSSAPVAVKHNTKLAYWIYPEDSKSHPGVNGRNSTCVALDLIFSDGTALRNLKAHDQHGNIVTPAGQSGRLNLNDWNHVEANIGAVASGKRIVRIDVGYDQPHSSGSYRGHIDDITLLEKSR